MDSLNRSPWEKPSHQSLRRPTLYNTLVLYATTKVHFAFGSQNPILFHMKSLDTFVAVLVLAAIVLALVNRQAVEEIVTPIIHSIF